MTANPGPDLDADLPARVALAATDLGGRVDEFEGRPRWWVTDPDDRIAAAATDLGLVESRRLFQMRRPLPLPDEVPVARTRAFDPERDVDAWLAINNAAFAWHPDQGGWTRSNLARRRDEEWFDLDDFRVADDDSGAMTGFCWTKLHPAGTTDAVALGEVYVIAVAPQHAGRGLGAALTAAGLQWQWRTHATQIGMLYVEADNTRAITTYERLGFEVHTTDVAFTPVAS